jgi:hypothetical protein
MSSSANVLVRGRVIDADDLDLSQTEGADADSVSVPAQWLNTDLPTAVASLGRQ